MINDYKISQWNNPIVNEADRPQRSASDMKAIFDSNSNQLRNSLNALIDILGGVNGAGDIGATVEGLEGSNVQALLTALKLLCDRVVTTGAGDVFLANDGTYKLPSVGAAANGVKEGGEAGAIYVKNSTKVYDAGWKTVDELGILTGSRDEFQPAGFYAEPPFLRTATLVLEEWDGAESPFTQTVFVDGVSEDPWDQIITISPDPQYLDGYSEAVINCIGQNENSLTFRCVNVPETNILVNIGIASTLPAVGENGQANLIETDYTLRYTNGVLGVNTTDVVEEDNTLPVTSAAVHTEVGNIEEVMETI